MSVLSTDDGPVLSQANTRLGTEDLLGIYAAQLGVHLTVDPYCLYVRPRDREALQYRPPNAEHRLVDDCYTWMVYTGRTHPRPSIGVQGDVWIDSTPHEERIYIRGPAGVWMPWQHRCDHDAHHPDEKYVQVAHPWLPDRCLQFTGLDIGWYTHAALAVHSTRWDAAGGKPFTPYRRLTAQCVARFRLLMNRSSASRVVFQPNHGATQQSSTATASMSPSYHATYANGEPASTSTAASASTHFSYSTPPPPSSGWPASPSASHGGQRAISAPGDLRGSGHLVGPCSPYPYYAWYTPQTPAAPAESWEVPCEEDPAHSTSETVREDASTGKDTQSHPTVNDFLAGLPTKPTHHSTTFTALGVTTYDHLVALSALPKTAQEEFYKELQARGLSFVETLVLRSALNSLRESSPDPLAGNYSTHRGMEIFLSQICPPMARHAAVFKELGVDGLHLPALSRLDAESYAIFEGQLAMKDVPWVECLLFSTAIAALR
ncbi:hypothetical protein GY45DRAFT_1295984 [Cubamyces sp. BRFM 1775]|nr:hypothetical protein GY45DRAFT_1295984 [Cubamyces sp. BRFM 1775]